MADVPRLVEGLIDLHQKYSKTYRAITTEQRYNGLVKSGILKVFTYDTELIREPLIEHVGHLPIIATYLHPHIEHSEQVNLGRSLIMLALHDIGETEVGDVMTFKKTKNDEHIELGVARKIIHPKLLHYYDEYEERQSLDAKFAKSVDALAPLLHEIVSWETTLARFEYFDFNVNKIVENKEKHFKWDIVLKEILDYIIIEHYRKMEGKHN